jgi:hypothetical protein
LIRDFAPGPGERRANPPPAGLERGQQDVIGCGFLSVSGRKPSDRGDARAILSELD